MHGLVEADGLFLEYGFTILTKMLHGKNYGTNIILGNYQLPKNRKKNCNGIDLALENAWVGRWSSNNSWNMDSPC